jgi:hypothetical protein
MRSNGAIAGLILVACCGFISSRAADSGAPSYPDWAQPSYLPALMIATTHPMPTVMAWYKSRVHGAWSESEVGNTWSVKSGGVRIQISANFYDESGKEKPATRVALTRYP